MTYDAAIIGGGPAGAALATLLSNAGRSVILFEKEKAAHDKVCGEFISHEGATYLERLGISAEALGSVPLQQVALARRSGAVTAKLPFAAQSLSRRFLDEALLQRARQSGSEIRRGARVRTLVRAGNEWRIEVDASETASARQAFLATGKHDLKAWRRPPGTHSGLLAFKMYLRLSPEQAAALRGRVELLLLPGGYAGLQPVEGDRANLCLLIRQTAFTQRFGSWEALLPAMAEACPHLAMRLDGAISLLEKPLAIFSLPYGHLARESAGLWRLGDQAAVIPSFSGDGMSIALHSAFLAARHYLAEETADFFQQNLACQLKAQVRRAIVLSRLLVSSPGQFFAETAVRCFRANLTATAILTRIPRRALVALSQ